MIVFIMFGILIVFLFDSFSFFVLYVIFCRNEGLDIKFKKWLILVGLSFVLVMVGGFMSCFGLVLKVCFLVLLILNLVSFGISCSNFVLE